MSTLYIHIGFHKTGSTSLQYALKKHEKELDKEGFKFLSANNSGNSSDLISVNLNRSQASVSISNKFFSLIKESNCSNAIISAEHLSFIEDEKELIKLRDISYQSFDNVKIVAYVRQQHKLAISFKKQAAKQPHINASPSSQLCGHTQNNPLPELSVTLANYLKFDKKYELWSSIFGKDNVKLKMYDKKFLFKSCICKDFSKVINLKNELPSININEGFSIIKTEIKHFLISTKAPDTIVNYFNNKNINDNDFQLIEKNLDHLSYHSFFSRHNKNLPLSEIEIESLNEFSLEKYKTSATEIGTIIENLLLESSLDKDIKNNYLEVIKQGKK